MKIDLHMHTSYSDGELSPTEIIHLAKQKGINIMAITDHDEIAAYKAAKQVADNAGIELISGIELNTNGPNGELHILGYGIQPEHPQLIQYINWRKEERREWSNEIVKKLQCSGYQIEWNNCFSRAAGGVIVRTHIADELVAKGYFTSSKKAYETLLIRGKEAFVEREPFSSLEAIELIHLCGGKSFLAHPSLYSFSWDMKALVREGIDGVEAYYSLHNEETTCYWLKEAKKYSLLVSAGSDFHGKSRSQTIGSVCGDSQLIMPWLDSIRKVDVL